MPSRFSNLLQERLNHLGSRLTRKEGCRSLSSPKQRRDVHVIQVLLGKSFAKALGLLESTFGQWRIDDAQPVLNPFGFRVPNEEELHQVRLLNAFHTSSDCIAHE